MLKRFSANASHVCYGMKKKHITIKIAIYAITLLIVLFATYRIQRGMENHSAMTSDEPSLIILEKMDTEGATGLDQIKKLWRTDKLPQRLFAMEKIRQRVYRPDQETRAELKSLVLEALADPDQGIQKHGVKIIEHIFPKEAAALIPLLGDADHKNRLQATRALARIGDKRFISDIAPLLDDPNEQVRIMAANALSRWTGNHFGVKFNAKPEKKTSGLEKWRNWVKRQEKSEKNREKNQKKPLSRPEIPAADFTLPDLDGKSFTLSKAEKPIVMLYFWGEGEHGDIEPMKHLAELKSRFPNQLEVIPISVDAVPRIHLGHENGSCDHHHDKDASCSDRKDDVKHDETSEIARKWKNTGFGGRCLVDDGTASFRYNSNELPVTVLIKNGGVSRRFVGNRPLEELVAMVNELISR